VIQDLEVLRVDRELREAICRLEMISHAPTMSLDPTSRDTSEEPGGRKPGRSNTEPMPRDPDEHDDWFASYHRKTPTYFRRRREKTIARNSTTELEALRDEALKCIEAWKRTPPPPPGVELEPGTFLWKCKIADDDKGTTKQRAILYGVGEATIHRYRARYRGLRKRAA
jgi:hypothetical protein